MKKYILIIIVLGVGLFVGCRQVKEDPLYWPMEWIKDAKVLNEPEAQEIALKFLKDYVPSNKGIITTWQPKSPIVFYSNSTGIDFFFDCGSCFKIEFEIPNFAKKGDRIWPLEFTYQNWGHTRIIWVNAETAKAKIISSDNICSEYKKTIIEDGKPKLFEKKGIK